MELFLKIGEIRTGTGNDVLKTVLGSCIGLCLWDPGTRIGGLVHIMLPDGPEAEKKTNPGKFAETAVDALTGAMIGIGCLTGRMKAKIAGGASMFAGGSGEPSFPVGTKNHSIVAGKLGRLGIETVFEHIGGKSGRNVSFDCAKGLLTVKVQDGRTVTG